MQLLHNFRSGLIRWQDQFFAAKNITFEANWSDMTALREVVQFENPGGI